MADQWYFAWDKQKFGPFSAVQLKELAGLGRLQPKDLGLEEWHRKKSSRWQSQTFVS